jgi:hypothetical protein
MTTSNSMSVNPRRRLLMCFDSWREGEDHETDRSKDNGCPAQFTKIQ